MKQRHQIALAFMAALMSCTPNVPSMDRDEVPGSSEPQDTTTSSNPPDTKPWETEADTTITITGTPSD